MNRLTFSGSPQLDTALLLPENQTFDNNKGAIGEKYFIPIGKLTGKRIGDRVVALGAYLPKTGKIKKAELQVFGQEILNYCDINGITTLIVAQGDYFKYFTGCKVVEKHIGESFQCIFPGFEGITITPTVNLALIDRFPDKQKDLDKANKTAAAIMEGTLEGSDKFEFESYELVEDVSRLRELFEEYSAYDYIACDIETTGLYVGPTELLTIAFAKDKYNAFTVPINEYYSTYEGECTALLETIKDFLKGSKGSLVFHNGLFDAKHMIYNMFMDDFNDVDGMLEGVEAIKFDDTFILAYLKLNSTVRPSLGLKDLAYDFLGDYAEDVKIAIDVPLEDLAIYNAKDVCGTYYVFENFKDMMDENIYNEIMKPSFKPLLKMMLNGMPLDLDRVDEVKEMLEEDLREAQLTLKNDPNVKLVRKHLREKAATKYNETHKTIQKTPGDFMDLEFNPNSSAQLRVLLFDIMGFEPVDYTKTKAPKTDRASIKEFLDYADMDQKPVLDALVTISQAGIVLNTFINAFNELSITQDGHTTLHGSLVLGGTQSSRMSSRDPNMQNLPSNSKWGKAIKSCFKAPEGWLFAGSDFNALELRIGGILSKDPIVRDELLKGLDGHSVRTYAFFPDELEELGLGDLDPSEASSINRIQTEAKELRQASKPIGFLKQYGGSAIKIQQTLKCTKQRAEEISQAYDELYKGTLNFAKKNHDFARKNGYVECAFGMKLRTPRINARDRGVASAEERSSSNAVTQSWGVLMNRAFNEFDARVEEAGLSHDIKLMNSVHDSVYLLIKEDAETVAWVNKNLIECMEWQEHPALESEITLGANLEIGRSWDQQIELENNCSIADIQAVMDSL